MPHEEYTQLVPGADTALVFIHGILGSPEHFRDFLPLVPENWSVCNLLLAGHGKGVRDFSAASMAAWRQQVDDKITELSQTHRRIFLAAHSMGTLFSIQEAVKRPEAVQALFLLASPLKIFLRPAAFINAAKVYFGNIKPTDSAGLAWQRACSVRLDRQLWLYLGWVPRFWELLSEIRVTRRLVDRIPCRCAVFQSKHDEMVARSAMKLLSPNGNIRAVLLENSGHHHYSQTDYGLLLAEFRAFCTGQAGGCLE